MLTLGEGGWRLYRNCLYSLCICSIDVKLLKSKEVIFEKRNKTKTL